MIQVNSEKAKEIAHGLRKAKRDNDYLSVDGGSMYATLNAAGKTARTAIKSADDKTQADIEGAADEVVLKQILVDNSLIVAA